MKKVTSTFALIVALCAEVNAQENIVKENLGPAVNSQYGEIAPYITPDGQKLFFVRPDHPHNTMNPDHTQDIWYCKKDEAGNWTLAQHLGKPFNKSWYNSILFQSADGNYRIIRGKYKNGFFKDAGFSESRLTRNGWSEPEALNIKGLDRLSKGKQSGICIAPDNRTMIIYLSEKEGSTNNNLYVSFHEGGNNWSALKPLGPVINTAGDESTPFIASDNRTLYFSSNRAGGLGNNDIWITKRLDDSWTNWSEPRNAGPSINSPAWDAYYTVPASGDMAYMVTFSNSYGLADIVSIRLAEEVRPDPVVLVKGRVLDSETGQPVEAAISYLELPGGKSVGSATSHPLNGEYQLVLPAGTFYGYKASAQNYLSVSENLDLTRLEAFREIQVDLYLSPVKVGQIVRLNNIFFETGKSVLLEASFVELGQVVKLMQENPALTVRINGHTDHVGTEEDNLALSGARAQAVVEYLKGQGIDPSRLSALGFGETKPVRENETEDGRAMNRRVEFEIINR